MVVNRLATVDLDGAVLRARNNMTVAGDRPKPSRNPILNQTPFYEVTGGTCQILQTGFVKGDAR